MGKKYKPVPDFIQTDILKPFVEKETEISKSDLITRIAGQVNYSFLQLMKLLQFHSVRKDEDDQLYIL